MALSELNVAKALKLSPLKGQLHTYFGVIKSYKDLEDCTVLLTLRQAKTEGWYFTVQFNGGKVFQGYGLVEDIKKNLFTSLVQYEATQLRKKK